MPSLLNPPGFEVGVGGVIEGWGGCGRGSSSASIQIANFFHLYSLCFFCFFSLSLSLVSALRASWRKRMGVGGASGLPCMCVCVRVSTAAHTAPLGARAPVC